MISPLRGTITSPVSLLTNSSAAIRPTIRSFNGSITPVPSTIASTSIPWISLFRTCTSFTSELRIASMPSSVRRVSAGKISTPSLSTIACTVSLFNIFWTIVSFNVARILSSLSPRIIFWTKLVWLISLSEPKCAPRNAIDVTPASAISAKHCSSKIVSAGTTSSPVSAFTTSLSKTRPISLSLSNSNAWRGDVAKRARSRTRSIPTTSQSSSRTITSWDTSTRRRVK